MRRRDFTTLLGGAVATHWLGQPSVAQAQSALRVFRIGHVNSAPQLVLTSLLGGVLVRSFQQHGMSLEKMSFLGCAGAERRCPSSCRSFWMQGRPFPRERRPTPGI